MTYSNDVALVYEGIIRSCYGCDQTQHNASADEYIKLRTLYIAAIRTEEKDPDYEENWNNYFNQVQLVISSLKKALSKANKNSLASKLDCIDVKDIGSIYPLSYLLGVIITTLNQ